jgi:hydroxyacylglutathione hydrolase
MIKVETFINSPIDSVTYIISNPQNSESIIIDPGTDQDERITNYLYENRLNLNFIFITHEHFDHILGINFLRRAFPQIKVISSEKTSERLSNPKKNLAIFHNQMNLIVNKSEIIVEAGSLNLIGLDFEIFETPGHTDSSLSLRFHNLFFSGDFLLKSNRVVTNLPSGSTKQYNASLNKYQNILAGLTIFPGHGEKYIYNQ